MPTHGAQQRAHAAVRNFAAVVCDATRHGSRAAYVAGCRCPESRKANRDYAHYRKQRTAQAAFGATPPFSVPAADTRAVVEQLRDAGWTLRRIEAATGIKRDHLARIDGRTRRPLRNVRWATHQKLVALTQRDAVVAGGHLIDAYTTWQRVHGLIALGYPKAWIARQIGNDRALQLGHHLVTARNAEKIRELADRFGATPGPSRPARALATRHGWTADLIWQADDAVTNDFNIGDPPDQPDQDDVDPVAIARHVAGDSTVTLNRAEKRAAFHRLRTQGHSLTTACTRLRLSGATGQRYEAARTERMVLQVANTAGMTHLEETG